MGSQFITKILSFLTLTLPSFARLPGKPDDPPSLRQHVSLIQSDGSIVTIIGSHGNQQADFNEVKGCPRNEDDG